MTPQEREAARARFFALFNDCFAVPRCDIPQPSTIRRATMDEPEPHSIKEDRK